MTKRPIAKIICHALPMERVKSQDRDDELSPFTSQDDNRPFDGENNVL